MPGLLRLRLRTRITSLRLRPAGQGESQVQLTFKGWGDVPLLDERKWKVTFQRGRVIARKIHNCGHFCHLPQKPKEKAEPAGKAGPGRA